MIKKVYILFILFFSTFLVGFSQTTDLIISEYGEGSSGNSKFIEIYNGTGASVNLANYRVCMISNGGSWCETTYLFTTASIANGTTLVLANNSTDVPGANEYSVSLSWNGDDAVSLQKFTGTWNLLDVIGTDGADPGSGWTVAATNNATKDHRLTRKATICSPNIDWDNSRGSTATNSEWILASYVTGAANVGHTENCSAPCSADPEPTTPSSTLTFPDTTCYSIDLSWLTGNGANTIVIASTSPVAGTPTDQTAYTANSTFGSGTTIAANEFVIHNGNGTSTTVTGLSATTTYYFAIFEYNGTLTNCEENYLVSSSLVGNFTTPVCPTSTNPEITGILVDACGGSEGVNEFLTFSNGNMPLSMNDLKVTFPFIPSYCNVGCGTNTWVTNPTYTSQLNTTAGCTGLFVEADPIPANANVIVFTGASPTFNFDFSGLCGTGPYYAIFANNTSTGGRFGNYNSDCTKYRETTIDFGTSQDTAVYQPCLLSSGAADGDYVAFSQDGTPTYSNDGCTPTATLPISLLYFKGKSLNTKTNLLEWTTTAEINNDYFTIERSGDAINFITIGTLAGAGNSNIQLYYQLIDDNPLIGINYYRLKQTDFNGDYQYANTIAIENNSNYNLVINNHTLTVITKSTNPTDKIEIYDAIGQLVYSANIYNKNAVNIQNFKQGIYIIKVGNATNYYIQKMKF